MVSEHIANKFIEEMQRIGLLISTEKLKVWKTTKGYNWEIQILEADPERLEQLNNKLIEKFGDQVNDR